MMTDDEVLVTISVHSRDLSGMALIYKNMLIHVVKFFNIFRCDSVSFSACFFIVPMKACVFVFLLVWL